MTGRQRGYDPEFDDMYYYGCEAANSMVSPTKSSSGTSASSGARPTQRYPQTTSARRRALNDHQTSSIRGYMAAEPCLSTPPVGPTAGQIASKFCSMQLSSNSRPTRSAGYSERPSSPRSASPGYPVGKSPRRQQEKPFDNYCDTDTNQRSMFCGKAPSAPKQVVFDSGSSEQPRAPRSLASRRSPASSSPKNACPPPYNKAAIPVSEMFDPEDQATLFGNCPNMAPDEQTHCSFQEYNEQRDEGLLAKLMKKIKGSPSPCPLKIDFSNRKPRNYSALVRKRSSCFSKKEAKDQSLEQLDDLWNPDTFMRWKCIDNWDQHKETLWRSVIQAKLDCPEAHNRCIEDMMYDAFKAMNAPGGECISFRMIYGILRRNEDMYLNPYIDHFTDEQFLKLIIALNRFFMQDKDKRKMFFDHPPPTFIEKIMMKETLGVLDPTSPQETIARRFWDLLLDWYARKINEPDEC